MKLKTKAKRLISYVIVFGALLSTINVPIEANVLIDETIERETVTKGLIYEHKSKFTQAGWIDLHVLKMDLTEEQVALDILQSTQAFGQKETLQSLAISSPQNVVAGINASFFNMKGTTSEPVGVIYNHGYSYAAHNYNTSTKGVASLLQYENGEVLFDFFDTSFKVLTDSGKTLYVEGVNKLTITNGPVIYNSSFGMTTNQIDQIAKIYKIIVHNNVVTGIVGVNETANIPIMQEGYVIAIPQVLLAEADYLNMFTIGTGVEFTINSTINTDALKLAISGSGKVLQNGQFTSEGYLISKDARQPRSVLGVTADQKYLIAMSIDGRGSSIGATHAEVAQYLREYNVSDAIQLDGGGSTTLVARDLGRTDIRVKNTVSDGAQRKILNGLGFVSLAETGPVKSIKIIQSGESVFKNNPIRLEVIGFDENYNPVEINYRNLAWSVEGITGSWGTNTFVPTVAGEGRISCYYEGLVATASLESLDSPIDIEVSPKILSLDNNQTGEFSVVGTDKSGYQGIIQNNDVTYTLENTSLGEFRNGKFIAGSTNGISKVTISMGKRTTTAYVVVGNEYAAIKAFESMEYYSRSYPEEKVEGEIRIETKDVVDTNKAYRFDYSFSKSSDAQAFYMMINNFYLDKQTRKVSLWVNGNNSGHMFRGNIIDALGGQYTLTFSHGINWTGWKEIEAEIPAGVQFPVQLDRLYVVALQSSEPYEGSLLIDQLSAMTTVDTSNLRFDEEGFINDPLMVKMKPQNSFEIKLFGPTSFKNRLLDTVISSKVYEEMNKANYGIFAGSSDVDTSRLTGNYSVWKNSYSEKVVDKTKIITLGTGSGGLRTTDYTQYNKLKQTLANTSEHSIIIIGSKNPLTSFADQKEGELVHKILKEYMEKTGKQIFYVNASGYTTDVTIKDGVRYIDTSGLWYKVQDRYVDLNKMLYQVRFFLEGNELSYMIEPIFPAVKINQ
jgi:exopolysaccharide biosynthesis protein